MNEETKKASINVTDDTIDKLANGLDKDIANLSASSRVKSECSLPPIDAPYKSK